MTTETAARPEFNELAYLENLRQNMQRHRIQMTNRMAAIERGDAPGNTLTAGHFAERFAALESDAASMIADAVCEHPAYPWISQVRGIGDTLAGALLAPIDIRRANSVSSFWRYAGQGVAEDGKRDRPIKGQRLNYNAGLKKTCYLAGTSFLRSGSSYRAEYDQAKNFYTVNRPDWTKAHIDMASRRKMVKLFLSHLWVVWRDAEGLPLSPPYSSAVMGHDGIVPPWAYVPDFDYSDRLQAHYESISRFVVA